MIDPTPPLEEKLTAEAARFLASARTLHLATVNSEQQPHASYAPFALINHRFYILVSDLAQHGRNLANATRASVLIIEDEARSRQLFARKRLSYDVLVHSIARDTELWNRATAQLIERFGTTVKELLQLQDFRLYELEPTDGRYVKGFGRAFRIVETERAEIDTELKRLESKNSSTDAS